MLVGSQKRGVEDDVANELQFFSFACVSFSIGKFLRTELLLEQKVALYRWANIDWTAKSRRWKWCCQRAVIISCPSTSVSHVMSFPWCEQKLNEARKIVCKLYRYPLVTRPLLPRGVVVHYLQIYHQFFLLKIFLLLIMRRVEIVESMIVEKLDEFIEEPKYVKNVG